MTEEGILEGNKTIYQYNKIIAEFMGTKDLPYGWRSINQRKYAYRKEGYPHQLKYHCSWEWIMPVFLKINRTVASEGGCYLAIHFYGVQSCEDNIKFSDMDEIKAVWLACIQAIQFYNQQNNHNDT